MKFSVLTAALIVAVSIGVGTATYLCCRPAPLSVPGADNDSLTWLRMDFALDAERMAAIESKHAEFQKICAGHCADIRATREQLRQLKAKGAPAGEISMVMQTEARQDAECRSSLDAHVREIAGLIGGQDGERYLELVLPRIARFDHTAQPPAAHGESCGH